MTTPAARVVTLIVIHCAATPNGRLTFADDVNRWHRERGFARAPEWRKRQNQGLDAIGYHFFIGLNGALWTGRHLDEVGAHVVGANSQSIGICMAGMDAYMPAQWEQLALTVRALQARYPRARVCGHRDLSPDLNGDGLVQPWEWTKTCPGFDVAGWLARDMSPEPKHVLRGGGA